MNDARGPRRYRAAWVVPIATPPIRNGVVTVAGGRILAVGRDPQHTAREPVRDLGAVALLPGLVNAHTHLELSYLRAAIPAADSFVGWIEGVMAARRARPDASSQEILDGVAAGIREAIAYGTAAVADISNTLVSYQPLVDSGLAGWVFFELIKFNPDDPVALVANAVARLSALGRSARVQSGLAAHAPYSVAPAVFRAIRDAGYGGAGARVSVHLSESDDEMEFIASGGGRWRALLEQVGTWDPAWVPPGTTPVAYLDALGFLDPLTLAVHGVKMDAADLARLASRRTTLVTCPRSNQHTGAGRPPVADFYAAGVAVAVGTDSLASTPDLNVFAELAAMRSLAPSVPASTLLASATAVGAAALGIDHDYGSIEPGKLARLATVALPGGIGTSADVEEYLVSGVQLSQIGWLPE